MSLDVERLFAEREVERYALHTRYLNEQMVREMGLEPSSLKSGPRGLFAISKNVLHRFQTAEHSDGAVIHP